MTASRSGRAAGKRVLITGAARGMGRSLALRLAEEGADLILIDTCQSLPERSYPLANEEDIAETVRLVPSGQPDVATIHGSPSISTRHGDSPYVAPVSAVN